MPITGQCFCGQIKYQIDGALKDAQSCHCSRCRKAFSAQASAYALVDANDFSWLSGAELLTGYQSQAGFGLQFCSRCGSTLCGTHNNIIHGITLGCLNDDPEIEIGYHLFIASKARWEVLPQGVTTFAEGRPEHEP